MTAKLPARLRDAAEWVAGSTYVVVARQTSPEGGLLHYSTAQALVRARPEEYVIERVGRQRVIRRIARQETIQRVGEPGGEFDSRSMLRPLSRVEAAVVAMLIEDAESMIADLARILSPGEQAIRDVRAARDWLRGIRDTRMVATSGDLREERARLVREIWVATVLALIPEPKPSWTEGFDETDDFQREVDARIGDGVAAAERERTAGDVITREDLERAIGRLAEITGNRDNYYPALADDMFRYARDRRG
jgi:hypothetical protein